MSYLKTTTMPVIVGALSMLKKGTDTHINKIPVSPTQYGIQKNCTLRNCLSTINVSEKYHPKEAAKT